MKQNETKIFSMFISRYTAGRNGKAVGWSLLTIVNLTRPKVPHHVPVLTGNTYGHGSIMGYILGPNPDQGMDPLI